MIFFMFRPITEQEWKRGGFFHAFRWMNLQNTENFKNVTEGLTVDDTCEIARAVQMSVNGDS